MYGKLPKRNNPKEIENSCKVKQLFFSVQKCLHYLSRCKGEVIQTDSIIALFWNYEIWRIKKRCFSSNIFFGHWTPPSFVWEKNIKNSLLMVKYMAAWRPKYTQFLFTIWFDKIYFIFLGNRDFFIKVYFLKDYPLPWQKKVCENVVTF